VALEDSTAFFALTLSGAQGRAILRDWLESSVARAEANLAQHFRDLEVCRNTPPPKERGHPPVLPLRLLLRSLGVLGDDKSIPAALAADLVQAALAGTPYPLALLQRAVERTRAEIGQDDWSALERRDARAALIKAVLNRRRRFQLNRLSFPEIGATVDPENPDLTSSSPAYALGRLMAVIERMQQIAINDPNASVVDRFFGAASATPRAVFPRLLKGLRHHARKALDDEKNRGQAIRLERETDRILTSVDPALKRAYDQWLAGSSQAAQSSLAAFPAYFSLEEQGLFILGYHHQRSWIWTKQEAREALAPADPSSAAADRDAETAHS
jgi:CRISPR-associated protein Csd1